MIKFNNYCNKSILDLDFGRLVPTEELLSRFESGERLGYIYTFYVYKNLNSGKTVLGYIRSNMSYDNRKIIEMDTRLGGFPRVIAFLDPYKEEIMKNQWSIPNRTAKDLVNKKVLVGMNSLHYTEIYE